jgi:hypothetical protein
VCYCTHAPVGWLSLCSTLWLHPQTKHFIHRNHKEIPHTITKIQQLVPLLCSTLWLQTQTKHFIHQNHEEIPHAPVQIGPATHPATYIIGTGSFPRVERRGVSLTTQPQPRTQARERVEINIYSPSGSTWPVLERILPLPLPLFFKVFLFRAMLYIKYHTQTNANSR